GPFADLGRLRAGDKISISMPGSQARYVVTSIDTSVHPSGSPGTLTLVTSNGTALNGGRLVVTSRLVSTPIENTAAQKKVAPLPAAIASQRVNTATSWFGDVAAIWPIALCIVALMVAVRISVWMYRTWSPWLAYLYSTPVLIALMLLLLG